MPSRTTAPSAQLVLTILAALAASSCGPTASSDLDDLRIVDSSKSPGSLLFGKVAKTGAEWAFEGDELNSVPNHPLDATRVEYRSATDRTEVDVFARDPDEVRHTLETLPWSVLELVRCMGRAGRLACGLALGRCDPLPRPHEPLRSDRPAARAALQLSVLWSSHAERPGGGPKRTEQREGGVPVQSWHVRARPITRGHRL